MKNKDEENNKIMSQNGNISIITLNKIGMSTPKDKDFQIGLTKKTEIYVRVIVPQGKIVKHCME